MNTQNQAALDAGTVHIFQHTDWTYLEERTDEELIAILNDTTSPLPGTQTAAERLAVRLVAQRRGLE